MGAAMKLRHGLGLLTLLTLFTLAWFRASDRATAAKVAPPAPRPGSSPLHPDSPKLLGAASCSGRACHGGLGSSGTKGSEYTLFERYDPHTRAYRVLIDGPEGERSRLIEKNLRPADAKARPETDQLCLSCHAPEMLKSAAPVPYVNGFGCESCHGPAEHWLGPHTAPAQWAKQRDDQKESIGFWPLTHLADRARVCTSCHVGEGERGVNHDLIAAGHPRLNFAFDTYLANLPRHWQADKDRDLASAWLVGEAVSAQAALELLAYRAEHTSKPWPEFAEYDCYACHHDLKADGARPKRGYPGRVPGTLPLNDWYFAMPRALSDKGAPLANADLHAALETLAKTMSQPEPPRAEVSQRAREAAKLLNHWLKPDAAPDFRPSQTLPKWIAGDVWPFIKQKKQPTIASWDAAAQLTLALRSELGSRPDAEADKAIRALFQQLQFSKDRVTDSPPNFDGPAFVEQLDKACKRLAKPADK
jgi:hypothetical protein